MDGIGDDAYLTIPYIQGSIYHALQGMEVKVLKPFGFPKKMRELIHAMADNYQ